MTSVIGFMTSTLFCRTCYDRWKCNGYIDCPWLSPHDEANCSQQCSDRRLSHRRLLLIYQRLLSDRRLLLSHRRLLLSHRRLLLIYRRLLSDRRLGRLTGGSIPCNCNKPLGNMTCEGEGRVCYRESGKLLVLFYFCKRHND